MNDLTDEEIDLLKTNMAAVRIITGVAKEHIELAQSDLGLAQTIASNRIADALNSMVNDNLNKMAEAIGLDLDGDPDTHLRQVVDYLTDGNRRQGATR